MNKILIFGASGLLGQSVIFTHNNMKRTESISGVGRNEHSIQKIPWYTQQNLREFFKIKSIIKFYNPTHIFNFAAMTNVDQCEIDKDDCAKMNRDFVELISSTGIPIIHISTDYVFSGLAGPYKTTDYTIPINHYGQMKLESEQFVLHGNSKSKIIRTMWLYGDLSKKGFVNFVIQSLKEGKKIQVATDQIGNPTSAIDLAEHIWDIYDDETVSSLSHFTGKSLISRYEWAKAIAITNGLNIDLIKKCKTSDLKQSAKRPLKSGLI